MKLLFFTAEWCGACKQMKKKMVNIDYIEKDIEIQENANLANQYNIKTLPTFLFLDKNNDEIKRIVGACDISAFNE